MQSQQTACLQAIGIELYQAIETLDVTACTWLPDVCALLNIAIDNCRFVSTNIEFDKQNKVLQLPAQFYGSEINLKKAIWTTIQPHVASQMNEDV